MKAGKPPVQFLIEDPEHREYTKWDFRLAKAYEIYEDMLQGNVPMYIDRSSRVSFITKSFVSKSKAALDRAEERASKATAKQYGRVFYAVPVTNDGGPLPTLQEYLKEQAEMEAGDNVPQGYRSKFATGRAELDNSQWADESP